MEMPDQILSQVSIDRIRNHIRAVEGVRHPVTAPAALERAAQYIKTTLASLGYCLSEHTFDDGGGTFSNVIATRNGTSHPERRGLVLAHFDTVSNSPGADDNASGVALLLELATILNALSFEKSIHFVGVNLEENAGEDGGGTGTRGSRALARFARENGWEIEAVLVLESVAYADASAVQRVPAGLPVEVPERGDFIAVVGNERSREVVQEFIRVIDRHRIALPYFSLVVPGNGEFFPDTRRSDHAPFWDYGYKSIMLTDTTNFRNPHYHEASDRVETLNLAFAADVCRATAALLMELATPTALTGRP